MHTSYSSSFVRLFGHDKAGGSADETSRIDRGFRLSNRDSFQARNFFYHLSSFVPSEEIAHLSIEIATRLKMELVLHVTSIAM